MKTEFVCATKEIIILDYYFTEMSSCKLFTYNTWSDAAEPKGPMALDFWKTRITGSNVLYFH
jgi:hypothetical protein